MQGASHVVTAKKNIPGRGSRCEARVPLMNLRDSKGELELEEKEGVRTIDEKKGQRGTCIPADTGLC